MSTTEQDAVITLQHAINDKIDEPDAVFIFGMAIADVTIDACNRGLIVDPLAGASGKRV